MLRPNSFRNGQNCIKNFSTLKLTIVDPLADAPSEQTVKAGSRLFCRFSSSLIYGKLRRASSTENRTVSAVSVVALLLPG